MYCLLVASLFALVAAQEEDVELLFRSGFEFLECDSATALKVIYKVTNVTKIVNCNPPRPYCDNQRKQCVKDVPQEPFYCEVDGVFPHMNDCNGGYICEGKQLVDVPCPEKLQFDVKRKSCRRGVQCKRPNCENMSGVLVEHPADNRLYVFCESGSPGSMHVCPEGKVFSHAERLCEFVCMGEGEFPDSEDPQKFYKCLWDGNKFEKFSMNCPKGMHYQYRPGDKGQCDTLTSTPEATAPEAPTTTTQGHKTIVPS